MWKNTLTVIVINPQRGRGAGAKPAAAAAPAPRALLASWTLPGDTGRRFGALTGDRNPIHLFPFTAQLFGFKKPIAHALYLVARLEVSLANAGGGGGLVCGTCARLFCVLGSTLWCRLCVCVCALFVGACAGFPAPNSLTGQLQVLM